MSILFAGGEDLDFPNGTAVPIQTAAGNYRAGFARCCIGGVDSSGTLIKSVGFLGGAVTSAWLSWRGNLYNVDNSQMGVGFGNLASGNWVGVGTNNGARAVFAKSSAGGFTLLGTMFSQFLFPSGTTPSKFDLQMINYGVSATMNFYINGALVGTFVGDVTVTGTAGLDSVFIGHQNRFQTNWCSEIIVSTESTLAWQGLVTHAPSGNGAVQAWSNPAYTNFNPITINDANSTFSNTAAQDEQASLIAAPAGNWQTKVVRVAARALATTGATASQLKLGLSNAAGTTVGVGPAHSPTVGYTCQDEYFTTDPVTGAAWAAGAMPSTYSLDLRSA